MAALRATVKDLVEASTATATHRARASDLDPLLDYCGTHGLAGLPASAETVASTLRRLAGRERPGAAVDHPAAAGLDLGGASS